MDSTLNMTRALTYGRRNSRIEGLRLLAMLAITLNHFPWDYSVLSAGGSKGFAAQFIINLLSNFGGVGDCLFFGISAWYLSDEARGGVRKNLKRIVKLEAQLLFFSLSLFVFAFVVPCLRNGSCSFGSLCHAIFGAVFPLSSTHWWYPTSYALFLLFIPFINIGLRAMGKREHFLLAFILLFLYSLFPYSFLGGLVHFDMSYSVWLFLYQYVVFTCFKWHFPEMVSERAFGLKLLGLGLFIGIGSQVVFGMPLLVMGKSMLSHQLWLNTPACLPSMFIAFGLLILAHTEEPIVCPTINKAASGTLAVYLILTDAAASHLIGDAMACMGQTGLSYLAIALLGSIGIFAFCIALDLLRQRLMRPLDSVIDNCCSRLILNTAYMHRLLYQKCHRFTP